jgi:FkbM family methyltransferase
MRNALLRTSASRFADHMCRHRGRWFADALEIGIDLFHKKLNNVNFDIERNGELRVLEMIAARQPKCIFDVGANVGDWSSLAVKLCPLSTIHAFEVVPTTCDTLESNVAGLSNVVVNRFGLSDANGEIVISIGLDTSTATACRIKGMRFHDDWYDSEVKCDVKKAADYVTANQIESIDFVKIDVEGMDLRVIKGFGAELKRVRALQFEYGIFNIASHDLLSDFCQHLTTSGFVVGKIFPRVVQFFEYRFNLENFYGSNYLAVRKEETDLIRRLSTFGG